MTRPLLLIYILLAIASGTSGAEDPVLRVEYAGPHTTDEDDLRSTAQEDIEQARLALRKHADRDHILALAEDAAFEMSIWLTSQGHPFSRIDVSLLSESGDVLAEDSTATPHTVRITVAEGPLILLGNATVTGVDDATAAELVRFVTGPKTSLLGSTIYVESALDGAAQRMRAWLRQRGHRDAEVRRLPVPELEERESLPTTAPPSPAPDTPAKPEEIKVDVTLEVEPGPVLVLAGVEVLGCTAFDADHLASRDPIQAAMGQPYGPFTPFDLEASVRDYYAKRGYPFVEVTANDRVEGEGETRQVFVTLNVREGPLVHVGAVRIRGNVRTQDHVVRRELLVHPGETFDVLKLERSQQRVLETGLFRQAFIDIERPDRPDLMDEKGPIDADLLLKIDENDYKRFETSVGFGTWELLRGSIGYHWVNVVGTGRTLGVELAGSVRGIRASVSGSEPWVLPGVLWDHTVGAAEVSIEKQDRPTYTYLRQAIGMSLTKEELLYSLDASLTYVFRVTDVTNVTGDVPEEFEGTSNIGSLTFGIVRDTRDNPWSPRKGSRIRASLEVANRGLGGDIDFLRLKLGVTQIFDLGADVRLVTRAAVGAIRPSGGQDEIPLQERFFLGGGQTVRSFPEDDLGPRFEDNGDESNSAAGGEYYSLFNVELRIPVWGDLEGALFLDTGNVIEKVRDASFRDFRYGVGAGLRYATPLGAVRVDAGVNPDPRDHENAWAIFFAIGYPF